MAVKQAKAGQPGVYNSSAPTLSDGEAGALQLDSSGNLKVALGVALSKTSDAVAAYSSTDAVMSAGTALTPKFAKIAVSGNGNNNLVAAVTSKKIRVLAYNFMSAGTVNAKFQSDGAGTPVDLTGLKYCVANTGICAPYNPLGWFESGSGKTLDLNLSGAIAVGGELVYVEV